jgi:hypothetical protein
MNNLVQETISNCVQKAGNVQVIENILDDSEIESLMKNEIIIKNKLLVENDTNDYKSLSFSLPVDNVIIDKINDKLKCKLHYNKDIPFKWVKGDTSQHTDKNDEGEHFDTHLIYLTDNSGKLKIDNSEYNITRGSGYIFNEGLVHETLNTDDSIKLILGPFNVQGDMIGPALIGAMPPPHILHHRPIMSMRSLFTNNAQVYYKPHSLSTGSGGVVNSRAKSRRT